MTRRMLPAAVLIPAAVGWVRWLGRRAGVVDPVMGLSLFVLADILIFAALVWWNAALLERMDRERRRAERRLGCNIRSPGFWRSPPARRRHAWDPASDLREPGVVGSARCGGWTRRRTCCIAAASGTRRRLGWTTSQS